MPANLNQAQRDYFGAHTLGGIDARARFAWNGRRREHHEKE
ncbi:MAG: hypothetical protein LAO31_17405 [Acidobacteriia bacterium]|nr:hypothetical protein [Terriglobia bacterium]